MALYGGVALALGSRTTCNRAPTRMYPQSLVRVAFDGEADYEAWMEEFPRFYPLPIESHYLTLRVEHLLIVLAISLLVRGFIAKALMPAAFALSASTT